MTGVCQSALTVAVWDRRRCRNERENDSGECDLHDGYRYIVSGRLQTLVEELSKVCRGISALERSRPATEQKKIIEKVKESKGWTRVRMLLRLFLLWAALGLVMKTGKPLSVIIINLGHVREMMRKEFEIRVLDTGSVSPGEAVTCLTSDDCEPKVSSVLKQNLMQSQVWGFVPAGRMGN
jgi:hypothetical protein